MTLRFHACPPPGQWINDPNGLIYDGMWRLFVQHRDDAPTYRATGWARLSSANGLDWTFDGAVIPAENDEWAYSGSVATDAAGLVATHTVHDAVSGLERQVVRTSADGGLSWSAASPLIFAARDLRDPFRCADGALLLARPCGWSDQGAASQLEVWREGADGWRKEGRIGPWHPPGVMWEVPVVVDCDGHDLLLISTVDRRGGGAECSVFGWAGTLTQDGFERDTNWPAAGQRIDLGPDFYAAMVGSDQRVVAWLSSWATARSMPWPGFAGGPISLARRISVKANRILHQVDDSVAAAFTHVVDDVPVAGRAIATFDGCAPFALKIIGGSANAAIRGDPAVGNLAVTRAAELPLAYSSQHCDVIRNCPLRKFNLFIDGPVVELFVEPEGCAVSLALPSDDKPFAVTLTVRGEEVPLEWTTR